MRYLIDVVPLPAQKLGVKPDIYTSDYLIRKYQTVNLGIKYTEIKKMCAKKGGGI
jgi:hypothetical protein